MEALKLVLISLLVSSAFVHSSEATCGGVFTAPSGIIESPGFPNDYANNVSCVFIITASNGLRITLNFTNFDLEPPAGGNCLDYVEIRDGTSSQSPRIGHFCNNNTLPGMRRSFGSQMWIKFSTDISVTGNGFRATYTTGTHDKSFFLIASSAGSIYRMDAETRTNYNLQMKLTNPIALDYDPVDQRVYFTEVSTINNMIISSTLAGSDLQVVMNAGIDAILDGLAVDPFSRLLFYTDAGNDVIGMVTLSTHVHRTIINSSLDKPRAIVLHTSDGVMFWTDWGGPPKIERANYDGSDRRTLVIYHLLHINALALDMANNRLYWADAGTNRVESVDLDGKDRPTEPILHAASTHHFFGMALFRNALYITDWGSLGTYSRSSIIIRQPLDTSEQNNRTVFGSIAQRMNDIHAYDQNWLTSGPNGCGNNKGGCLSICLPLPSNQSKCSCPDGQSLLADNKTCADVVDTTPSTTTTTTPTTTTTTTPTTTTTTPTTTTTTTTTPTTTTTTTPTTTTTTTPTTTTTTPPTQTTTTPELSNVPVVIKTSHDLPFIADGSSELTLTCNLDYTVERYAWNVQCSSQGGNWCVFQPTADDDKKKVTCTVILADGRAAAGSLVLSLKYPPQTPPYINGYKSGSPLRIGDRLSMTCAVQGGKPLVSAVLFSCQDHPDIKPDIRGKAEVHSQLTIDSLRKEDNGTRCECSAEWEGTSTWYPPRQTITLLVIGGTGERETQPQEMNVIPIVGGAIGGVVLVIVIVIIIVVIVKRSHPTYAKPPKKKKHKGKEEEEHPYSDLAVINKAFDSTETNGLDTETSSSRESTCYAEISELPIFSNDTPPLQDRVRADLQRDNIPPPPIPCGWKEAPSSPYDGYLHPTASPPPVPPKPANKPAGGYARFIKPI